MGAYIQNSNSAVEFAQFLWHAFGPVNCDYTGPRPFGDVVLDGFDFDIESDPTSIPVSEDNGYAALANEFRSLFALEPRTYYLSAAPQCFVPDGHLANAIANAYFDFM